MSTVNQRPLRRRREPDVDIQRLTWLVAATGRTLADLPDWEWPKLKAELVWFLDPYLSDADLSQRLKSMEAMNELSGENIIEAMEAVNVVLKRIAAGADNPPGVFAQTADIQGVLSFGGATGETGMARATFSGTLKDKLLWELSQIFRTRRGSLKATIRNGQFRHCPICEKLFFLRRAPTPGRRYYCSPACSSTASTRLQRAKAAAKQRSQKKKR